MMLIYMNILLDCYLFDNFLGCLSNLLDILNLFSICSFQGTCRVSDLLNGICNPSGLKWTRTTDLTLIRRAL